MPPHRARAERILALQPGKILLEGGRARQAGGRAALAVQGKQILKEDRPRPAIAEQMMLREQQAVVLGREADQRGANQGCLLEHKTSAQILRLDGSGALFALAGLEVT